MAKQEKQWFRLIAGKHVGPDLTQEPVELTDPQGRVTRKYPSKTYVRGDVFESTTDLLTLGLNKFEAVNAPPGKGTFDPGEAIAPGGQVSSGLQQAGGAAGQLPAGRLIPPTGPEQLPATPPDLLAMQRSEHGAGQPGGQTDDAGRAQGKEQNEAGHQGQTYDEMYGDLEQMTNSDLKEIAAQDGVDISQARNKADLVRTLRAHRPKG